MTTACCAGATRFFRGLSIQRICIYIPTLHGGGAERMMVNLANDLTARGYIVDLVLVEARGPYLAEIAPGVSVVDLGAGRCYLQSAGLRQASVRTRPAVIVSALSHANLVAILARILSRVPCPADHQRAQRIVCTGDARTLLERRPGAPADEIALSACRSSRSHLARGPGRSSQVDRSAPGKGQDDIQSRLITAELSRTASAARFLIAGWRRANRRSCSVLAG